MAFMYLPNVINTGVIPLSVYLPAPFMVLVAEAAAARLKACKLWDGFPGKRAHRAGSPGCHAEVVQGTKWVVGAR